MNKNKPHKYFADQFEDEEVLLVFRKHPIVMRKGLILASVAVLLGTIPGLLKPEYSYLFLGLAGGFLLAAIIMFFSWVPWYFSVYIMTNQRFIQIAQKGFFKRSVVDLALHQIQMVNYEISGLQETLLGFGTIMVQTFAGDLVIHDVHHPAHIQKRMLHNLRDLNITRGSTPILIGNTDEDEDEEEN